MSIEELSKIVSVLFGAGGVAAALQALGKGAHAAWTGKARAEKTQTQDLTTQRDAAWLRVQVEQDRADMAEAAEAAALTRARVTAEYASLLRRRLIEAGTPEDRLPPWPNTNTN